VHGKRYRGQGKWQSNPPLAPFTGTDICGKPKLVLHLKHENNNPFFRTDYDTPSKFYYFEGFNNPYSIYQIMLGQMEFFRIIQELFKVISLDYV
jgi:hypothetical protein